MRKLILLLCFVAPVLAATPSPKVLIIPSTDGQPAKAIVGDMRITASSITYEANSNSLVCVGNVELGSFGSTATTDRLNVKLPSNGAVFFLNDKGIEIKASKVPAPFPAPTKSTGASETKRP